MAPYDGTYNTTSTTDVTFSGCTGTCPCCCSTRVVVIASPFWVDDRDFDEPTIEFKTIKGQCNIERFMAATSRRMRREVKPLSRTDRHNPAQPQWREYCRRP